MDSKLYPHISNLPTLTNNTVNKSNTTSLTYNTPQNIGPPCATINTDRSTRIFSEPHQSSTILITQPTVNKLSSEVIKQEELDSNPSRIGCSFENSLKSSTIASPTVVTRVQLNPCETVKGLTMIPLTNASSHILPGINSAQLSEGTTTYFVSGDNYKLPGSSNNDLPSPSSSSNSSNPPSSANRRRGDTSVSAKTSNGDQSGKRAIRLQKNREAARECRRKKKEYIKCLEERVNGLENQNKALIEELRQLKELYCQRDETIPKNNNNNNNKTSTNTR